jgi:cytochrome P450
VIPIRALNRSEEVWGDGKVFRPERWLEGGEGRGKWRDIQGYRHILTFGDGPRMCLGRGFALAEIKVRVSRLIL